MRKSVALWLFVFAGVHLFAATSEERIAELEKRVTTLEQRLLEQQKRQETMQSLQRKAHQRAQADVKVYSRSELQQIEKLYQTWGQKKGEEQKAVALTLLEKYPKANRTGCALLYLARRTAPGRARARCSGETLPARRAEFSVSLRPVGR
jgi:hypothetical protein